MKKKSKFEFDTETMLTYVFLGLSILGIGFAIFYTFTNLTQPRNINIVLIIPVLLFLTPYLVLRLYKVKRVESKMGVIPRFIRDVVDNLDSGMDMLTSIKTTTGNEYSVLNEDIQKLSNQLSWGVDFDKAFMQFAENVGSVALKRDFRLVIEARRVGGHVEKILRELSVKINIENLRKKERKNNLASNTFTGYISFVIFIFIIILVYNNLFLGIAASTSTNPDGNIQTNEQMSIYLTLLMLLSYELAILSGFLFGMMEENDIITGAPHVVILIVLTFIGFFFFIK